MSRYILIRRLRGPAFLLLIGIVALLHQTGIVYHMWRLFWPLALILWGLMLLAERAALELEGYPPPYPDAAYPGGPYAQPPVSGAPPPRRVRRSCLPTQTIWDVRTEASYEQHAPLHASRRWCAAPLRSAHPMARLPRAAESRLARAAGCIQSPASRDESGLWRLCSPRSLHRGSGHPGRGRRHRPAGGNRPY